MTIYVNNAGAGTFTDEFGASNVWSVGSDANDGFSFAAPILTANELITTRYLWSDSNRNVIVLNQGTYTYTDAFGEWTLIADMFISGSENFTSRLVLDGTSDDGLKFNISTPARSVGIGKIELGRASSTGVSANIIRYVGGTSNPVIDIACRLIVTADIKYMIHGTGNSGVVTLKDGCGMASDSANVSTLTRCINLSGMQNNTFTVESFDFNGFEGDLGGGLFILKYTSVVAGGGVDIKGITGTVTIPNASVGSNDGQISIVSIDNAPDGATIENDLPINVIYAGSVNLLGFGVRSPVADALSADDARIFGSGSGSLSTTHMKGVLARIGGIDVNPHNCADGIIEDLDVSALNDPTSTMHGVAHFGTTGGIRRNNKISGCFIPDLTKLSSGVESHNNEYRDSVPSDLEARIMYAKGAGTGSSFHDNKMFIDNIFGGVFEASLEDDGGAISDNVTYTDNQILDDGGSFTATAIFTQAGLPGDILDLSTLTSTNLGIASSLTLPTNVAQLNIVFFSSIEDANATLSITNMHLLAAGSTTITTPYSLEITEGQTAADSIANTIPGTVSGKFKIFLGSSVDVKDRQSIIGSLIVCYNHLMFVAGRGADSSTDTKVVRGDQYEASAENVTFETVTTNIAAGDVAIVVDGDFGSARNQTLMYREAFRKLIAVLLQNSTGN